MSSELHEKLSHLRDIATRIKEAQTHPPSLETLHEWLIAVTELVLAESELARLHREAILDRLASLEQLGRDLQSRSSTGASSEHQAGSHQAGSHPASRPASNAPPEPGSSDPSLSKTSP